MKFSEALDALLNGKTVMRIGSRSTLRMSRAIFEYNENGETDSWAWTADQNDIFGEYRIVEEESEGK